MANVSWWFYFSKVIELMDTVSIFLFYMVFQKTYSASARISKWQGYQGFLRKSANTSKLVR
jgi:hypothetical protein